MSVIERMASVPFTAEQMLLLVNDIDRYPEFLHWCHGARIESDNGSEVVAALEIGISGIYKTIRTKNTTTAGNGSPATVRIDMLDGPLKHLHGAWVFDDSGDAGCVVHLRLEYEVHFSPLGMMLRALFDEIANSQLSAFVKRAGVVYGNA